MKRKGFSYCWSIFLKKKKNLEREAHYTSQILGIELVDIKTFIYKKITKKNLKYNTSQVY